MLSKRSLSALTPFESYALQWLRSRQCSRCFHISLRRGADETASGNDNGTQVKAPKRGPTRQQRAALASQEVQMLQRDRPDPTFNNPQPSTARPEGAGQTVDPENIGLNSTVDQGLGGRMARNDSTTQEGPLAQGINMSARTDVSSGADTRAARSRGVRSMGQPTTVEDGSERGGSGLEAGLGKSSGDRLTTRPSEEDDDDIDEDEEGEEEDNDELPDAYTGQRAAVEGIDYMVQPDASSSMDLIQGMSGSTIAASNFIDVIEERLKALARSGELADDHRRQVLARKLKRGKLVSFESKEEKAAVLELVKRSTGRRQVKANQKDSKAAAESDGVVQPAVKVPSFTPLPMTLQKAMVDQMVAGKYDEDGLLEGSTKHKQPVLNEIAKATMMNGTYLNQDGDRLLKKVRSLLPSATASQGQQRNRKPQ